MTHPLDGAIAKINRVSDHLEELDKAVLGAKRDTPPLIRDFDPNEGCYTYRAESSFQTPSNFSILVGECAYQLRSALDHIAWQLAIAHCSSLPTPKEPSRRTQFPIFDRAPIDRRQIQDILPDAIPIIESLQPYSTHPHNPHLALLWLLHSLNIADKHRTIVVITGMSRIVEPSGRRYTRPFHAGDVLLKVPVNAGNNRDVESELKFGITLGEPGPFYGSILMPLLARLHNHIVHNVGPAFRRFFPPFPQA